MSDTPRTDAVPDWNARCELNYFGQIVTNNHLLSLAHEESDELRTLAGQLERELAACQQECKDREAAVMVDLAAANARVEKLKADRDKLLVMASRMADAINRCQDEDDCSDLSAAYDFRQEYPR